MKDQAKPSTLSFLKRNAPADERTVNRLFVSAFIEGNQLMRPRSAFLSQYLVCEEDSDYGLYQEVRNHIKAEYGEKMTLEVLVRFFEYVVSPADRIVSGAVYTPKRIREVILSNCLNNKTEEELRDIRIADISCGCGGFLMDAALFIHQKTGKTYADIFRENVYGVDVQQYAIERTKLLLSLLALMEGEDADFEYNLLCRDSLDYICDNWDVRFTEFDVVVGNPPYVCSRKLTEETRAKLKKYEVCTTGHPDLYIPFFQIAIEMLNGHGRLGYITMNTFLRSVNGRGIRDYFSRNRCAISVIDFRGFQVFDSKNTYTCLFFYNKQQQADGVKYSVDESGSLNSRVHYLIFPYAELDVRKGWALNKYEETTAYESIGVQIKDYCSSRHGIATLSNDTFIFMPVGEDEQNYYLESGGKRFPIEKGICRNVVNPNKLNTVDDLNGSMEKLIFPYRVKSGRAIIFTPDEMQNHFPMALAYLMEKKTILAERDKRKTDAYPKWYAFGRTQSLVLPRYKLFFPKFANKPIKCVIYDDPDLMLYNGLAFVNNDDRKLRILKCVIESDLFWRYIKANGKPYSSGYYSLSGVDIKHFGIPIFTKDEENELLAIRDRNEVEVWLSQYYNK